MKKLNRKGFTLIELLAVIVILAIILVVTVPNIIQSINDARINSIHNLAVSVANTYDNAYAQDLIATDKVLGNIPESMKPNWQCIGELKWTDGNVVVRELSDILGLDAVDVILTGTVPSTKIDALTAGELGDISSKDGSETCSAIRLRNGNAEVLLVAENGGRFYVAQYYTYAVSTAAAAGQNEAK